MSNFSFDSIDSVQKSLAECSVEKFVNDLPLFSTSELADHFLQLTQQPTSESKKKLESLFQFIDSSKSLELLAKYFSLSHFLSFLGFLHQHPPYRDRLTNILVGLQPAVFFQALHVFEHPHLDLLKHESLLEPIQYHLLQFVHKGESLRKQLEQEIEQFKHNLLLVETEELTSESFQEMIHSLDSYKNQLLDYLECASTALSIVWNTDRIDLIEKVSAINEILQSQLMGTVGHPSFDHLSSTGLYSLLEHHFSTIFDSSLKDDDAALEGLTRLSIWYLKDYWELGLLPSIHQVEELDLNPQQYNEEERRVYQHDLIFLVQQQLERLHIATVGDLKKSHIFSKHLLKRYIDQHKHLLIY